MNGNFQALGIPGIQFSLCFIEIIAFELIPVAGLLWNGYRFVGVSDSQVK
jgi:hypothetical protein